MFYYWQSAITKTYIDKLNQRTITELNNQLLEKQAYIEWLEKDKDNLSRVIHKDKKLIPALAKSVNDYLYTCNLSEEKMEEGKALSHEIHELLVEREAILHEQEWECNKLPSTGVMKIDSILNYLQQRAHEKHIQLQVTVDCNLKELTSSIVTVDELEVLVADLIDNAIVATRHNKGKQILVNFAMISKCYAILVSDSGIPFTKEVLVAFGDTQITTHADDDGNGIGLMETAKLLRRKNASLYIDELHDEPGQYMKKISVIFNKKRQYVLYTTRDNMEIAYLNQRTNLIVMKK